MLDVYNFIFRLSYDAWEHNEAKQHISKGEHFPNLQEACALVEDINTKAGLEVLYFFLDEIITDEYNVNPRALECFLDILPNFCKNQEKIKDLQRGLWDLGNLVLDQKLAMRMVLIRGEVVPEAFEAVRIGACYILGKVKEQVAISLKKAVREGSEDYKSTRACIVECMRQPNGFEDTDRNWKDKTDKLNTVFLEVSNDPVVNFDNAVNLIKELKDSSLWTVSSSPDQIDLITQIINSISNQDNAALLVRDLNEMLKTQTKRPPRTSVAVDMDPHPHFTFNLGLCLIAIASIVGMCAVSKVFKLTYPAISPANLTASCGISLAAGVFNSDNLNTLKAICGKTSANKFKWLEDISQPDPAEIAHN